MLLAKNRSHGELRLEQHLRDTENAALALFKPGTRWGHRWPAFFRVAEPDKLLLELRVAALFHDIGKANEDFQKAVVVGAHHQPLRHEHISALVMCLPVVRNWLESSSRIDVDVCIAAVLSHHLKAESEDQESRYVWGQLSEEVKSVGLRLDHEEVVAVLQRIAQVLQLESPPPLPKGDLSFSPGDWRNALKGGRERARKLRRELRKDPARAGRLAAVKAGLIAADSVASGLFREGTDIDRWVQDVAHSAPIDAEVIHQSIIGKRLQGRSLHQFQVQAASAGPRALLLAACGAGKTLAAWNWASAQAREQPIGRVIFLYPTRGTATEGFRDYAGWAPEGESLLLHGTASYELSRMQENPADEHLATHELSEGEASLRSLGLWGRRFFSATVDQFLGALQYQRGPLCLLPALADAAIIIDEVHSFDCVMFDTLIAFLKRRFRLSCGSERWMPRTSDASLPLQEPLPRWSTDGFASNFEVLRREA